MFAFQSSAKVHIYQKGHKVLLNCLQMHKKQLGFVIFACHHSTLTPKKKKRKIELFPKSYWQASKLCQILVLYSYFYLMWVHGHFH